MKIPNYVGFAVVACIVLGSVRSASAIVEFADKGIWPEDWPKELEPLRESSRTVGVATGIRQDIYEIPIPDTETFEKVWPAGLELRTPGSPLTLDRVGTPPPKSWGDLLHNDRPAVRIYAPTGNYAMKDKADFDAVNPPDFEKLVAEGRALRARAPWPKSVTGPEGELPEYVVAETGKDGRLKWVAADPFDDPDQGSHGFYYRARIDIELVIDGETIDLNRVKLPDGVTIFDHRFDETR